jgi:hypothetical protein
VVNFVHTSGWPPRPPQCAGNLALHIDERLTKLYFPSFDQENAGDSTYKEETIGGLRSGRSYIHKTIADY